MSFQQEFETYSSQEKKYALWRALQTLKTAKQKVGEPIIRHFAKLSDVSSILDHAEHALEIIIEELEKHGEHPKQRRTDKKNG